MKQRKKNCVLTEKLIELNELEAKKAKVLVAIFVKTTNEMIARKVQLLQSSFEEQAEFYDQDLEDYDDIYKEILSRYEEQLLQVIDQYNEFYMNVQLELQETECNQKIAMANLKKSFDMKQEIKGRGQKEKKEEYNIKLLACMQKKINYDRIIEECEKELNECAKRMKNKVNALFADKTGQISLSNRGSIKKAIHKIIYFFSGTIKFNTYVVDPINVELEMLENKLPDIINEIKEETIQFVAKIKQAKDETDKIFEDMI